MNAALRDLYGSLVREVLYPLWEERIRKRPVLSRLSQLRESEGFSLTELEALQARELRALLFHASTNVPHYREVFAHRGLGPDDFSTLSDLRKLPILSRQEARASVETRLAEGGPRATVRKTTGGTTGEPLVIRYDLDSEHWRQAVRLRGFGWAGYRIGDPVLHYWGQATTKNANWKQRAKERVDRAIKRETYVDCTLRSEDDLRATVELIRRKSPRCILCYAQAGAHLARFINRTKARTWGPIQVICGAERIFPDDRQALEQAFGEGVFETYGCRETMLIATECVAHRGLHQSMENLIVELVDAEGEPAAPGQPGRVLLTDLHNFGSPLIRYENGDIAIAMDDAEPCPCGRAHRRLASVEGRSTETLRDASGNAVGGMVFNLLFSPLADEVDQFQAVQHADGSITVKLVTPGAISSRTREHLQSVSRKYLPGVSVDVQRVDEIPLSKTGKRRVVVVEDA